MRGSAERRSSCPHPERMTSLSSGLRGTSYTGCSMGWSLNPERVVSSVPHTVVNPTAWRRERTGRGGDPTLTGLVGLSMLEPRVARASQPWAERCNPFGIAQNVQTPISSKGGEGEPLARCSRPPDACKVRSPLRLVEWGIAPPARGLHHRPARQRFCQSARGLAQSRTLARRSAPGV